MDAPGRYWIADTEAERPTSGLFQGDRVFCKDTNKLYFATNATTWANTYGPSGGGGLAVWGGITGVLSAQADLQSALDGRSATGHNHDGVYAPFGSSGPSTCKKTADQTFNSATLANVTGLSFAVTSGVYYHFRFLLLVRSNTATVGVKFSCTVPAFTTFGATGRGIIAADGVGAEFQGAVTTSGDAIVPTAVPAINTDYVSVLEGVLLPSANGTLQVQAATETGTTIVTVRQGSCGVLFVL